MSRSDTQLPAVAQGEPRTAPPEATASAIDAQCLGQAQSRRGLRGGRPVLEAARAAYLSAQWSGAHDRRPEPGLLTRTRV